MIDIRATHYVSPLSEVEFTDVPLTVHIVNAADETGLVTGKFRVYNDTTGLLIHTSDIAPFTLTAGQTFDATALTNFSPPAPLDDVYFVLFDGNASNPLVPDGINFTLGAFYFDVKPGPLGPPPAAHAPTHEQGGADPIETGDLGTAELDTTLRLAPDGAGGVLWDPSIPAHHLNHESGGGDQVDHAQLINLTIGDPHTQYQQESEKGVAGGYCGLPNPLDTTLPLRADGTPARPTGLFFHADFINNFNTQVNAPWISAAISGGGFVGLAGETNHPGILRMQSAVGANTGYRSTLDALPILISGGCRATHIIRPQTLANSTIRCGFLDTSSSADATDGCYFEMTTVLAVPGTIVGKCAAAGVRSTTASSFVLVTNTWYHLSVQVNAAANLVTFYIYSAAGALLWSDTVNANIPTVAGQETGHGTVAVSSGSVNIVDLDYLAIEIRRALVR